MKIKILLLLIAFLLPALCFPQEESEYIGKTKLRSDDDSSKLRINRKVAREFDGQLFDFNSNHFSWSASSGLSLNVNSFADSVTSKKVSIVKDTAYGETTHRKSYAIKRDYFNQNDSTQVFIHYTNNQYGTSADWYLINKLDQCTESTDQVTLSNSYTTIYTMNIPHLGLWRFSAFFDAEFAFGNADAAAIDSIYLEVRVMTFPVPTVIGHWVRTVVNQSSCGEKISGQIIAIVPEINLYESAEIQVRALCSNNTDDTGTPLNRYIDYIRCELELIH